eukprot:7149219-Lingulodinium_polyedra.AAC.1
MCTNRFETWRQRRARQNTRVGGTDGRVNVVRCIANHKQRNARGQIYADRRACQEQLCTSCRTRRWASRGRYT